MCYRLFKRKNNTIKNGGIIMKLTGKVIGVSKENKTTLHIEIQGQHNIQLDKRVEVNIK